MIPRQLHIKNFLSYGPEIQIIDFSPHHLICLSGKNGHGKSALLDAITWAIWGQARKTSTNSKPDAGLLHLGQKHMMVILEFEVNNHIYRIRREYLNTATKPFATLDFGIKNNEDKFIALTDKTIKDTQEKIEQIIGISYEAFSNSTFLRQGQSNEFSKKSPKERKEILAQILQLQQFDEHKKIAQHHAKILHQNWLMQNSVRTRITQELTDLSSIQEQYQTVQNTIKSSTQKISLINQEKTELEKEFIALQARKHQEKTYIEQNEILSNKIKSITIEINQIKIILDTYTTYPIDQLKIQETVCLQNMLALQRQQQEKLHLKEQYLQIKEELNKLKLEWNQNFLNQEQSLTLELTSIKQEIDYLIIQKSKEAQTVAQLENQHAQLIQEKQCLINTIQALSSAPIHLENQQNKLNHEQQLYHQLQQELLNNQKEAQLIQDKKDTLINNQSAACPLCLQQVTTTYKQNLETFLINEETKLQTTIKNQTTLITTKNIDIIAQQNELLLFQNQCKTLLQAQIQEAELTKQLESITRAQQNSMQECLALNQAIKNKEQALELCQKKLTELDINKITNQPIRITVLTQNLESILQAGKTLNFQETQLQQTQNELQEIQKKLHQYQEITKNNNKESLQGQKTTLEEQLDQYIQEQKLIIKQLESYKDLTAHYNKLIAEQERIELCEKTIQKEHQEQLIFLGNLEQKKQKLHTLTKELSELDISIKQLQAEINDYQEIARALGKDGIQALLIEQAIPEIEHETNLILARLTNNQTQIFIESLRDLKKGGNKETLDIKIADAFGLRDYEMFSGGEAFRIDFALRIGIAKLLARRAGTTLQTIFIDEGFGSQDEEGLQLIMDNLYKIQDDFAKIIIVSHLPEMKDHFPVQFIIEKKRSGSTVSIIEQG